MKKLILFLAAVVVAGRVGAETNATDEVTQVIRALKTHYVDANQVDNQSLQAASVAGILSSIGRGAVLLSPSAHGTNGMELTESSTALPAGTAPVARAEIIQPDIGYIHLVAVTGAAVNPLDVELKKFVDAKATGYVLDLRYAGGDDYAAAAAIASRFLADGQELFVIKRAGQSNEVFHASTAAAGAFVRVPEAPLMLLVNAHTTGSAEALVGALRAQDRGIVIGSLTAGSAVAWDDVPLVDGQILRLASAKVVLEPGDPKNMPVTDVFPNGIAPDIFVSIDPSVEREVLSSAATNVTLTVSLQPTLPKQVRSEAELLKAFRGESVGLDLSQPAGDKGEKEADDKGEIQNVRDVVLQRAVDVLKGIRVLLSWQ